MALYKYDPNKQTTGVNPLGNGWTQRMSAPNASAIVEVTTPIGTKAWGYTALSHIAIVSSLDAVPTDVTDCEILLLARTAGATGGVDDLAELAAVSRMGGAVGALTGYARGLRRSYSAIEREWTGDDTGGVFNLLTHSLQYLNNSWYWVKMQSTSTTHRARVWLDDTEEPSEWILSITDTDYLSGQCGFGGFHNPLYGSVQLAWFGVGTGTDSAPHPADEISGTLTPIIYYQNLLRG